MIGFLISMIATGVFCLISMYLMELKDEKDSIVLDLNNRYNKRKELIEATVSKLEKKGRKCRYLGEDKLDVDGQEYLFTERDFTMGRIPLQRVILRHR